MAWTRRLLTCPLLTPSPKVALSLTAARTSIIVDRLDRQSTRTGHPLSLLISARPTRVFLSVYLSPPNSPILPHRNPTPSTQPILPQTRDPRRASRSSLLLMTQLRVVRVPVPIPVRAHAVPRVLVGSETLELAVLIRGDVGVGRISSDSRGVGPVTELVVQGGVV